MNEGTIILAVIIAAPILYLVLTYNRLISLKNYISESWSNIDTELKRRYDLIPRLVSTVKAYAAHEAAIFERVAELRAKCIANNGRPKEQASDETKLVDAIRQLLAVVENYPRIKADEHFLSLQKELVNTEDRIQAARRFFNGNVRDYRNTCESFPSNLIASLFSFKPEDFFDVPPSVRDVPDVGMEFRS